MRLGNYFAQSRSKVIKKMSFLSFYEQNGKKVKADLKVIGKLIWAWMENLFLFHNKNNKSWKLENCLNEKSLSKCNSSKWWSEFLDSNLLSHSSVIACSGKKKSGNIKIPCRAIEKSHEKNQEEILVINSNAAWNIIFKFMKCVCGFLSFPTFLYACYILSRHPYNWSM